MRSRALRPFVVVLVATIALAAFSESARADPYTVAKGDTLEKIAKRTDTTVADLVARNKLRDANQIRVGAVLDAARDAADGPSSSVDPGDLVI